MIESLRGLDPTTSPRGADSTAPGATWRSPTRGDRLDRAENRLVIGSRHTRPSWVASSSNAWRKFAHQTIDHSHPPHLELTPAPRTAPVARSPPTNTREGVRTF